jgi:hypothetical protein
VAPFTPGAHGRPSRSDVPSARSCRDCRAYDRLSRRRRASTIRLRLRATSYLPASSPIRFFRRELGSRLRLCEWRAFAIIRIAVRVEAALAWTGAILQGVRGYRIRSHLLACLREEGPSGSVLTVLVPASRLSHASRRHGPASRGPDTFRGPPETARTVRPATSHAAVGGDPARSRPALRATWGDRHPPTLGPRPPTPTTTDLPAPPPDDTHLYSRCRQCWPHPAALRAEQKSRERLRGRRAQLQGPRTRTTAYALQLAPRDSREERRASITDVFSLFYLR